MLDDAIRRFLVSCEARNLSAGTIKTYGHHMAAYAAGLPPGDDWSATASVEAHLAARKRAGLSPNTCAGDYRVLNLFFAWCVKRGVLAGSPMTDMEPPRVPRKRQRAATAQEVATLLASIPRGDWYDLRDRLIVQTLFFTGIRVAELCRLKVGDFDMASNAVVVRSKGGDDRHVPLLRPVIEAYIEYRFVRPDVATDWLLVASASNRQPEPKPITGSGVRYRLGFLCERAGIRYLNPHAFRHGLAVHLLNDRGADMSLIQAILGHASISTTASVYAIWEVDGVAAQFERLMSDDG